MIPAVSAAGGPGTPVLSYQWVAVGGSGALYTSTSSTASSWTSQTSSFGTTAINCVASNGTNLYVAGGASGKVATSPDGITWTQRTSGFGTVAIQSVAYGNGYWVIVGNIIGTNYMSWSTDGITWTTSTTNVAAMNGLVGIEYGNGLWVALGSSNGEVYTATDPSGTWTARTSNLATGSLKANLYAKSQGVYLIGTKGAVTTATWSSSTNGTTWTSRNSPVQYEGQSGNGIFISNASVIAYGGKLSAGGSDISTSTDGTTWTDRTPAVTTNNILAGASDNANLLVFMNSVSGANIQTSPDGTTWTDRGTIAAGFAGAYLCHSSGKPAIR